MGYCSPVKALTDESEITSKSDPKDDGDVKGVESSGGGGSVKGGSLLDSTRVKLAKSRGKIQGSSITLHGSGDRSGKDIDNSMSLGDFYGRFVVGREDGEG